MTDIATIILAAGKGTRMNKIDGNKVTTLFHGIPLIALAVETALAYSSRVVVVVGVHEESVRKALAAYPVEFVHQQEQKGTAHATELATLFLSDHPSKYVIVGYGDHMMFYSAAIVKKFIEHHISASATVSLVTAYYEDSNSNAYGRIIRTQSGQVTGIVEQKDATDEEKAITEINAGLYCFDFSFLRQHIGTIKVSLTSGEHYLTDMVAIAHREGKRTVPFVVPFEEIGYGINSREDLEKSLLMNKTIR